MFVAIFAHMYVQCVYWYMFFSGPKLKMSSSVSMESLVSLSDVEIDEEEEEEEEEGHTHFTGRRYMEECDSGDVREGREGREEREGSEVQSDRKKVNREVSVLTYIHVPCMYILNCGYLVECYTYKIV